MGVYIPVNENDAIVQAALRGFYEDAKYHVGWSVEGVEKGMLELADEITDPTLRSACIVYTKNTAIPELRKLREVQNTPDEEPMEEIRRIFNLPAYWSPEQCIGYRGRKRG